MTTFPSQATNLPSIPGYTLLDIAGRGGMGAVYMAQQLSPRRIVAIKVLRRVDSAASLATFRREAQVIAGLEHPHIVPLYAFGEHAGAPYLTLRYLDGGTASDKIKTGPIDLKTVVRWISTIADALDFAHKRGVVHRDIKPSNILLDKAGNAYLADFGIAGAIESAASGPATGSAAYMPPEQGRGEQVDGRGDIYSLAVTLFEMLTGQKPYTAETAFGVIVRHLNDPIPSARTLNPAIPGSVDELIQWGMAKAPDERPATAAEFARLLQWAVANPSAPIRAAAPVSAATMVAAQPTLVAEAPPAPRKSNTLLWIGLALLLGVCAIGAVVTLGGGALAIALAGSPTPLPTATRITVEQPTATVAGEPTSTPDPDGGVTVDGDTTTITILRRSIEFSRPLELWGATDVLLQATARQESGPNRNEMGLMCRLQDDNNYAVLAISGEGNYSIWVRRNGDVQRLVDWTPSPVINQGVGAINQLEATCAGTSLRLRVNGVLVGEAEDPQPISGDVGLLAGLRDDGELVVTFEGVEAKAP